MRHLDRAENVVPISGDLAFDGVEIRIAITRDQTPGIVRIGGLAEEEDDLDALAGRELDRRRHRAAGIESGARQVGQARPCLAELRDERAFRCGR